MESFIKFEYLGDVVIDPVKVEGFKKYLLDCEGGFADMELDYDDNGNLQYIGVDENPQWFPNEHKFAEKFSEIIKSGSMNVIFVGENGEVWGWRVSPNKIEKLIIIGLTSDELRRHV